MTQRPTYKTWDIYDYIEKKITMNDLRVYIDTCCGDYMNLMWDVIHNELSQDAIEECAQLGSMPIHSVVYQQLIRGIRNNATNKRK